MDCVRMQLFGFYWSHLWTNPYLMNQLMEARIDCPGLWPIVSLCFLMGGSLPWRGGVFEVIQSVPLWFTLSACVWGDGVVGVKESPGGSPSQNAFFGSETPLKIAPQTEENDPPVTTSVKFIQRNDCATRITNKRSQAISNASQLASLKTDGIKVLIASLPANYPSDSILSFAFPSRRCSWRRLSAREHRIPHSDKQKQDNGAS